MKRKSSLPFSSIERIKKSLSEHYGGVSVDIDSPISIRDYSEIFRATIRTRSPVHVAIKHCVIPHTATPDSLSAKAQFLALERVNAALSKQHSSCYRTSTPLLLFPELATFAMSWIDGCSVTKKLHTSSVFSDSSVWFQQIGAWLGTFHKAGYLGSVSANIDERLNVTEDLSSSPLPYKSFIDSVILLKTRAPTLQKIRVHKSWLHGDCKTDNFILSGNDIYGIDISLTYENPVEYDLAQFLNNLDLLLASPQYLHIFNMRINLERAFLQGYSFTGPSFSKQYLDWLRLNFILSFWKDTISSKKSILQGWILNNVMQRTVDQLSKKISADGTTINS